MGQAVCAEQLLLHVLDYESIQFPDRDMAALANRLSLSVAPAAAVVAVRTASALRSGSRHAVAIAAADCKTSEEGIRLRLVEKAAAPINSPMI